MTIALSYLLNFLISVFLLSYYSVPTVTTAITVSVARYTRALSTACLSQLTTEGEGPKEDDSQKISGPLLLCFLHMWSQFQRQKKGVVSFTYPCTTGFSYLLIKFTFLKDIWICFIFGIRHSH